MATEAEEATLYEALYGDHVVLVISHQERTTLLLDYATNTPIYTIEDNSNGTKSDFFAPLERDGVIGTLKKGIFGRKLIRDSKSVQLSSWIKTKNGFLDSEERDL
jgi:hypothetical protein